MFLGQKKKKKSERANEKYFQVIIQNLKKGKSVVVQKGKKWENVIHERGLQAQKYPLYAKSAQKKILLKEAQEIVY